MSEGQLKRTEDTLYKGVGRVWGTRGVDKHLECKRQRERGISGTLEDPGRSHRCHSLY